MSISLGFSDKEKPLQVPGDLGKFVGFWLDGQIGMSKVIRWKGYGGEAQRDKRKVFVQDCCQHILGLHWVVEYLCAELQPFGTFDESLIKSAATAHDLGEGFLGRDVLYTHINRMDEKAECEAFLTHARIAFSFSPQTYARAVQAYMLQYCLKDDLAHFPQEVQDVVIGLRAGSHIQDARLFQAAQIYDYLCYGVSQYRAHGNIKVLIDVLKFQLPRLDKVCETLAGFRERIWPDGVRLPFVTWLEQFIGTEIYERVV